MDTKRMFFAVAGTVAALCASAEVDWTANPVVVNEGTEASPVEVGAQKDVVNVHIGDGGSGFVEMLAGGSIVTPEKSGGMIIGATAGSEGVLRIDQGGLCSVYSVTVGRDGSGSVAINGGSLSVTRTTYIGSAEGSIGEIVVDQSGTLSAGTSQSIIGKSGTGIIRVVNGTYSHAPSILGGESTGCGIIWLMTDASMTSQNNSATIGSKGSGIVYMRGGNWRKTGTGGAKLCVRETSESYGVITGWGDIEMGKKYTLDNNGLVVADGKGDNGVIEERKLTYTATGELTAYTNSIENVSTNGWYAVNKGWLSMSITTSVPPGDSGVVTWGEAEDDDEIDLVNSARVTFHAIANSGTASKPKGITGFTGNLYAADRSDVPALPGGAAAVGVWSFDIDGLYETADFEFRYDHVKAPKGVKLYQLGSDGETWTKLEAESFADYRVKVSGIPRAEASRMFAAVAAAPSGLVVFVR